MFWDGDNMTEKQTVYAKPFSFEKGGEKMLERLIGAQIVKVDECFIEVKKDGKIYTLEIISHDGDCCGYADFETKLFCSQNNKRNPIITNVTKEEGDGGEDSSIVTFFGESKPLAAIESVCGSGSGWEYGAFVKLQCKALDIDEILAEW